MTETRPDTSEQIAQIRQWIAAGECIDITLTGDDDSRDGIPLAVSDTFVAILCVEQWHSDGVQIIPLDKISDIKPCPERRKILAWNGIITTNRYFWLDIDSYAGLFQSLKRKDPFITVEDDEGLDVGLVAAIGPDFVKLSAIDPDGDWCEDLAEYAYKDITVICVDCEYANILGAYCRQAVANG
jgi:hypothetical protein